MRCLTKTFQLPLKSFLLFFTVEVKHLRSSDIHCNCNYIFINQLPWPEDSEYSFRSLSQAATCLVSTTQGGGFALFDFIYKLKGHPEIEVLKPPQQVQWRYAVEWLDIPCR